MQLDDERMRHQLHDVPLNLRVLLLVIPYHEIFFESLHCIYLAVILFLCHINFPK